MICRNNFAPQGRSKMQTNKSFNLNHARNRLNKYDGKSPTPTRLQMGGLVRWIESKRKESKSPWWEGYHLKDRWISKLRSLRLGSGIYMLTCHLIHRLERLDMLRGWSLRCPFYYFDWCKERFLGYYVPIVILAAFPDVWREKEHKRQGKFVFLQHLSCPTIHINAHQKNANPKYPK